MKDKWSLLQPRKPIFILCHPTSILFFSHCQQRSDNATMVPKYWQNAILFLHTWTINHNHPDADRHQVYTHLLIRLHFSIHHSRMIQGTSPDQTNNILMRNWNLYNLFKIISTFVNFSRIGPHNIYRRMWLQKRTCFSNEMDSKYHLYPYEPQTHSYNALSLY